MASSCILFWDYESSRLGKNNSAQDVANCIRDQLRERNYVAQVKLVFTDLFRENSSLTDELQKCGFDFVSCHHDKGKPEEVDKRMICTMMRLNHTTQKDVTFVVITRDCDFCNVMNTMRDLGRNVMFLAMGDTPHHSLLYASDEIIRIDTGGINDTGEVETEPEEDKPTPNPTPAPRGQIKAMKAMDLAREGVIKTQDEYVSKADLAMLFYKFYYKTSSLVPKSEKTRVFRNTLEKSLDVWGWEAKSTLVIGPSSHE